MSPYSWRVPAGTSGNIRFVASQDTAALGPTEGAPVNYYWSPLRNVSFLYFWILLLPLLLLKPNRNWRAWMIYIPVFLISSPFLLLSVFTSFDCDQDFIAIAPLVMGLGAVFLLVPWLQKRRWFTSNLLALAFFFGFCLLTMLAQGEIRIFARSPYVEGPFEIWHCAGAGIIFLLALSLAARRCRARQRSFVFFSGLVFLWQAAMVLLAVLVYGVLIALSISQGVKSPMLAIVPIAGVAAGIVLCLLVLPFLILAARNTLFRSRLQAWLKFGQAAEPAAGEPKTEEVA